MPPATSIPWPTYAVLSIKTSAAGSDVTATHTLARAFSFLSADEYAPLRDFYQKVAAADQQPLILTSAPSASPTGNGN
jgi:hypothetical protein